MKLCLLCVPLSIYGTILATNMHRNMIFREDGWRWWIQTIVLFYQPGLQSWCNLRCYCYGHSLVRTGSFFGIIQSINGILLVLTTGISDHNRRDIWCWTSPSCQLMFLWAWHGQGGAPSASAGVRDVNPVDAGCGVDKTCRLTKWSGI